MTRSRQLPAALKTEWVWRLLLGAAVLCGLLRISQFTEAQPVLRTTLTLLQGGFLVAATLVSLTPRTRVPGEPGRDLKALTLFAVLATASGVWSLSAATTIEAALPLFLLAALLYGARSRRWATATAVLGDSLFIFWMSVTFTAIGLAAAGLGFAWADGGFDRWQGLAGNPNYAGMMAAMVLPIGLWSALDTERRKAPTVVGMLVLALGLGFSGSRGSMLAAVLGLSVVLWAASTLRSLRLWDAVTALGLVATMIAAALGLLGAFGRDADVNSVPPPVVIPSPASSTLVPTVSVSPSTVAGSPSQQPTAGGSESAASTATPASGPSPASSSSSEGATGTDVTSGRLVLWRDLIEQGLQRPLLGWGFGVTPLLEGTAGLTAHNLALLAFVELGLVGLAAGTWLAWTWLRRGSVLAAPGLTGAVIAVAVIEITESSLFGVGGPAAVIAWILLAAWASTPISAIGRERST